MNVQDEVKLTKQSQAILGVLRKEMEKHVLTEEQIKTLTEALEYYDALSKVAILGIRVGKGIIRIIIALSGFITAWYVILGHFGVGDKQ